MIATHTWYVKGNEITLNITNSFLFFLQIKNKASVIVESETEERMNVLSTVDKLFPHSPVLHEIANFISLHYDCNYKDYSFKQSSK